MIKLDYFRGPGDEAYYDYFLFEKYIYVGDQISADTLAHELFHRIDHKGIISKKLLLALKEDYKRLKVLSKGNSSIKEYLINAYPNAFEYNLLRGQYVFKPQYSGISDILNGLSGGKTYFGYGHPTLYWKTKGNLESESWAQFGRIYFANDPDVIKLFSVLFPNLEEKALVELEGLL